MNQHIDCNTYKVYKTGKSTNILSKMTTTRTNDTLATILRNSSWNSQMNRGVVSTQWYVIEYTIFQDITFLHKTVG